MIFVIYGVASVLWHYWLDIGYGIWHVKDVVLVVPNVFLGYLVTRCVMRWLHVKYNYFSLGRRPSEIILFQHVETGLKLFQNYFGGLLLLMNIFQHGSIKRLCVLF